MGRGHIIISRWRFNYKRQRASSSLQKLYRSQVRVLVMSTASSSSKMNGEILNGDTSPPLSPHNNNSSSHESIVEKGEVEATKESDEKKSNLDKDEQEVVFIQDMGFTVKIVSPGTEAFDIQVSMFINEDV